MPRRNQRPKHLFLSHAQADHSFAQRLVQALRDHGVNVWYSPHEILGAAAWQDEIGEALERSDWFAVVMSPAAAKSIWVKREVQFALNQPRLEDRIIPITWKPHDPIAWAWPLHAYQAINFQAEFRTALAKMLKIWNLRLKRET